MRPTGTSAASEQEYPYGWRFVKRVQPDGTEVLEQVAMTLEDVLHPLEGDVIPKSSLHDADCNYLSCVFRDRPLAPSFALVTHDLLVDWGVEGIRNHSPDLAVFVGLSRDPRPTGLLRLSKYKGRCEMVVEVVSPNTRSNDVVDKRDHYYRIGIPLYVIIDQLEENGPRLLHAYRWTNTRYKEVDPDEQGRILLPSLGLLLGLHDEHAVCFDAATGEQIGDYSQIRAELDRERESAKLQMEEAEQALEEQILARQAAERRETGARQEADKQRQEAELAQHAAELAQQDAELAQQEADNQRTARERAENEQHLLRQVAEQAQQAAELAQQEADRRRQETERAQQEADRQRQETERAQQEAERAQQEADRQRLAREEAENQQELLQQAREKAEKQAEDAARRIRDLEDLLSRLQSTQSDPTNPTS